MSVWGSTYIAAIAPVSTTPETAIRRGIDVAGDDGERVTESLERHAFTGTEVDTIPVLLRHNPRHVVGRLTQLARSGGWHIASFVLDPDKTLAPAAADLLRLGCGVSVAFDSLHENSRLAQVGVRQFTLVRLRELSILGAGDKPVYPGACIVAIVPRAGRKPAAAERHEQDARRLHTRDCGEILGLR